MKKTLLTILFASIFLLSGKIVNACDNSSASLISQTDLGGGQYEFVVEFCAGGGQDGTGYGADQGTYTWSVALGGGATFISYPATLTSPQTGAVFAAWAPFPMFGLEYLVYDYFSHPGTGWGADWWTTTAGGWGPPDAYCTTFTIVTNGMPTAIILGGAEGAGVVVAPYGCNGTAEMQINLGFVVEAGDYQSICEGSLATLNATVTGGDAPFTYLWSNGATTATTSVNPTTNTTYSVTVTDANGATAFDDVPVLVNPRPVVNAGLDKLITKGYGPACVTLNGSATGGSDPKTYSWSNGSTIASPSVCPTTTTTYTLTVTDYYGCSRSDQTVVTHKDVRCGPSLNKVYMCKNGNTYCYTVAQVPSKLSNGYVLGACWMKLGDDVAEGENPISIFPNPANQNAEIVFVLNEGSKAIIEIYNTAGVKQLISNPEVEVTSGVEITHVIALNELAAGMYQVIIHSDAGEILKDKLIVIH